MTRSESKIKIFTPLSFILEPRRERSRFATADILSQGSGRIWPIAMLGKGRHVSGPKVVRIMQGGPGRSGTQKQERNSQNLDKP